MRILVFCSDLLPVGGVPASGGGLRSWQMVRSLQGLGHEVVASMPICTFLAERFGDRIPQEVKETSWHPWEPRRQQELVASYRPDAVLFTSTWLTDQLGPLPDCLRLYDLDGPQLLEMHYKGHLDRASGAQQKVERLAQADFVFCAGHRQRYYFWPFLLLAGHDLDSPEPVPVIPMAFPDELPEHEYPQRIEILAGGGFYPWQDPTVGLEVLGNVLRTRSAHTMPVRSHRHGTLANVDSGFRRNDDSTQRRGGRPGDQRGTAAQQVRLRIIGTSHGVTGADDEQFARIQRDLAECPGVEFHDFLPREEYVEWCRTSSLAFELHAWNPERELAITTRTIDALWCGLPVLYNAFGELADWIRRYDAGWTVDPTDRSAIARVLGEVLDRPEAIPEKGRRAQQLARERFTDRQVIGPLARFLAAPVRRTKADPVKIIPMAEYRILAHGESAYRDLCRSRAVQVARAVSVFRHRVIPAKAGIQVPPTDCTGPRRSPG